MSDVKCVTQWFGAYAIQCDSFAVIKYKYIYESHMLLWWMCDDWMVLSIFETAPDIHSIEVYECVYVCVCAASSSYLVISRSTKRNLSSKQNRREQMECEGNVRMPSISTCLSRSRGRSIGSIANVRLTHLRCRRAHNAHRQNLCLVKWQNILSNVTCTGTRSMSDIHVRRMYNAMAWLLFAFSFLFFFIPSSLSSSWINIRARICARAWYKIRKMRGKKWSERVFISIL